MPPYPQSRRPASPAGWSLPLSFSVSLASPVRGLPLVAVPGLCPLPRCLPSSQGLFVGAEGLERTTHNFRSHARRRPAFSPVATALNLECFASRKSRVRVPSSLLFLALTRPSVYSPRPAKSVQRTKEWMPAELQEMDQRPGPAGGSMGSTIDVTPGASTGRGNDWPLWCTFAFYLWSLESSSLSGRSDLIVSGGTTQTEYRRRSRASRVGERPRATMRPRSARVAQSARYSIRWPTQAST